MSVFQLIRVNYKHPRRYPRFGVYTMQILVASTLQKAEEFLQSYVQDKRTQEDTYVYFIRELPVDMPAFDGECLSERVYSPTGELIDHRDFSTGHYAPGVFRGRSPEEIRFKKGDIVEILWDGEVHLAFVATVPPSREDAARVNVPGVRDVEVFDDNYMVFTGPEYCFHEDIDALRVFAPRFKVPEATRRKIERKSKTWLKRLS